MMALTRERDASNKGILPVTSSTLEKDLVQAASFSSLFDLAVRSIPSAKLVDQQDDVLVWLLLEYGLTRFLPYQSDKRALLEEGMWLNKHKGTVAAVEHVAEWVGFPDASVWESSRSGVQFPCFEMDLGRVPLDSGELCPLAMVVAAVKPLRSRFRRVFSGWNIRQLVLDENAMWGQFLSGYSGVALNRRSVCSRQTGLIVSLGITNECGDGLLVFPEGLPSWDETFYIERLINCCRVDARFVLDEDYWRSFYEPFMRVDDVVVEYEHDHDREDTVTDGASFDAWMATEATAGGEALTLSGENLTLSGENITMEIPT